MNTGTALRTGPVFLMSLQPGGMDRIQMLRSILNLSLTVTPTPSPQPRADTHVCVSPPLETRPQLSSRRQSTSFWLLPAWLPPSPGLCGHTGPLAQHCHSLGLPEAFLPRRCCHTCWAPHLQLTCWAPALTPGTCCLPLESPRREAHTWLALCPDIGTLCLPACLDTHLLPETVRSFPPGTASQPTSHSAGRPGKALTSGSLQWN